MPMESPMNPTVEDSNWLNGLPIRKNQLTARSIVNRVWQRHFGKPLAGNPNNFGAKEKSPLIQSYSTG